MTNNALEHVHLEDELVHNQLLISGWLTDVLLIHPRSIRASACLILNYRTSLEVSLVLSPIADWRNIGQCFIVHFIHLYTQFLVPVQQNSHISLFEFNIVLVDFAGREVHTSGSGSLRYELHVLHSDQDLQGDRGKLCDFLVFLKDMELDSAVPQLYKLFSLVATIWAPSAGVERSFSCLKQLQSSTP